MLVAACFGRGGSAIAEPPSLLVPPGATPDSIGAPPPAPLIVPGRTAVDPDTVRAARARRFFLTGVALESARPGPSLLAYDNALQLDPSYPEANYRMGLLYVGAGQVERAVRSFERELRHHPDHLGAARELALARSRLDRHEDAIAALDSLARAHPDDDETWRALGFVCKQAGRAAEAEEAYRNAIRVAPDRPGEHRDLAVLLAAEGRPDEARAELKRAIALADSDAASWYNLGNLERREQRFDAALEAYREAEARDSSLGLAVQGQVGVLLDLNRTFDAGKTYRRWLDRRPDDHSAREQAVQLFEHAGRGDIALEIARDGVAERPETPDTHVILGGTLGRRGALREALEALREAESLLHGGPGTVHVRELIAGLRAAAPDSLRGLFEADSVRHARGAAPTAPR